MHECPSAFLARHTVVIPEAYTVIYVCISAHTHNHNTQFLVCITLFASWWWSIFQRSPHGALNDFCIICMWVQACVFPMHYSIRQCDIILLLYTAPFILNYTSTCMELWNVLCMTSSTKQWYTESTIIQSVPTKRNYGACCDSVGHSLALKWLWPQVISVQGIPQVCR